MQMINWPNMANYKIKDIKKLFNGKIIQKLGNNRVFMWQEDAILKIGTVNVNDGLPEIHYVSIEVGN